MPNKIDGVEQETPTATVQCSMCELWFSQDDTTVTVIDDENAVVCLNCFEDGSFEGVEEDSNEDA